MYLYLKGLATKHSKEKTLKHLSNISLPGSAFLYTRYQGRIVQIRINNCVNITNLRI